MADASKTPLQQAQTAVHAGHKAEARQLLQQILAEDAQNFKAWLLLASIASSPQAAAAYVDRAAASAPTHPAVVKAQRWATAHSGAPVASSPARPVPPAAPPVTPNGRFWSRLLTASVALVLILVAFWIGRSTWEQATLTAPTAVAIAAAPTSEQTAPNPFSRTAETDTSSTLAQTVLEQVSTDRDAAVANPSTNAPHQITTEEPAPGQTKNVGSALPRPTWTPTPLPTPTLAPTSTPIPTDPAPPVPEQSLPGASTAVVRPAGIGPTERWIDVNLSTQTLVALEGDTAVMQSLISSGTAAHPTVTGQYRTWLKQESQDMNGYLLGYDYYLENVPYVMYFFRDYAIHGTYWHSNFGTPMSHGCVNVNTVDAGWLFNWAPLGTLVNVHY